MRFIWLILLTGCGYSATNSQMIGQIKKVMHNTPLICRDFDDLDLSLGVMRNGTGSMSSQDVWINLTPELLVKANHYFDTGSLVKITYNTERLVFCVNSRTATNIEEIK